MKRFRAIIFDMDGVLIDSEPIYQQEIITCLKERNVTLTSEELRPLAGGSDAHFNEFLAPYAKQAGLSMDEFNEILHAYSKSHPLHYPAIMNLGVHETLGTLKRRGYTLALASSSPSKSIEQVVKACDLSQYFAFTISGELFQESKPNPEIYLNALKKLQMSATEVAAVEDSTYGILAAKRAGLYCFGKHDDRFQYRQEHADLLIEELEDLLPLLPGNEGKR